MPTATWTEAPLEETQVDQLIKHLHAHGVFDEAERLLDRLANGTENSEVIAPAEVHARLARYC